MHRTVERQPWWYKLIWWTEQVVKETLFHFEECGQCILKDNAFICPMRCPKNLRNGPCGGVRADGHCEVYPDLECLWFKEIKRAEHLRFLSQERVPHWWQKAGLFIKTHEKIQPPLDWRMRGTSSWVNHAIYKNDRFLSLPDKEGVEAYEWHCRNEKIDY